MIWFLLSWQLLSSISQIFSLLTSLQNWNKENLYFWSQMVRYLNSVLILRSSFMYVHLHIHLWLIRFFCTQVLEAFPSSSNSNIKKEFRWSSLKIVSFKNSHLDLQYSGNLGIQAMAIGKIHLPFFPLKRIHSNNLTIAHSVVVMH